MRFAETLKMPPDISFTAVNPWVVISGILVLFGSAVKFVLSRKDNAEKAKEVRQAKANEDRETLAADRLKERNREERRLADERRELFDEVKAQLRYSIELSQVQAGKMNLQAAQMIELQATVARLEKENAELRVTVDRLTDALKQYTNSNGPY